ncbi:hypothetical protein [Vibrio vulnificus]|uniref:hypothetical protein n=1 Tax=Vibrio vulnificus TaxID=672 RepID=UPI0010295F26|nr:hypothetical protein [Vibrio vulnificus]RZP61090.1 hypothetical protein D8T47_13750 [Vibrio vulnificus]
MKKVRVWVLTIVQLAFVGLILLENDYFHKVLHPYIHPLSDTNWRCEIYKSGFTSPNYRKYSSVTKKDTIMILSDEDILFIERGEFVSDKDSYRSIYEINYQIKYKLIADSMQMEFVSSDWVIKPEDEAFENDTMSIIGSKFQYSFFLEDNMLVFYESNQSEGSNFICYKIG